MRFNVFVSFGIGKTVITGFLGMALLVGVFTIPNLMAASPDAAVAEQWIRGYLKQQVLNQGMAALKGESISSEDHRLAVDWEQDLDHIAQLEFTEIEIRHFLVAPPSSSTRIFVVKTLMRDYAGHVQTRYFSLNATNKFFDFFWVAEQSVWMWYFSF